MHSINLTDKQLAGQRLMAGFNGTAFNETLRYFIGELCLGGIILFARNIETPDQVRRLCREIQDHAATCGLPPLFIAVDQEGGQVARLRPPSFAFTPGNPSIRTATQAAQVTLETAEQLNSLGINMNLAPVLDVVPNGFDSIMSTRVFKGDAQTVATLGAKVIQTLQSQKIISVAKHFPGIGRTVIDSHLDLPVLDSDLSELESSDLVPFHAAKAVGVSGIMLSHILYSNIDSNWPASLSPAIAEGVLRNNFGFNGIVMTDDLDMKAVKHPIKICIDQILKSGIDIALICHEGPDIKEACKMILKLITTDETLYQKGIDAAQRILALKSRFLDKS